MNDRLMTRLALPVAILGGLLLIIAVGAAWYIRDLQRTVAGPISTSVASVRAAQELEISIREVRKQLDRYLITAEQKHLEPVPRLKERTADALADAERAAHTPEEQA